MKRLVVETILVSLSLLSVSCLSQNVKYSKTLITEIDFLEGKITDTAQLNIRFKYTNRGNTAVPVYSEIVAGERYQSYTNIFIEVYRLDSGEYQRIYGTFTHSLAGDLNKDLNKTDLLPSQSHEVRYNILNHLVFVRKGQYKMRVHLLKIPVNNPKSYSMEYAISNWFNFEVLQYLALPRPAEEDEN